MASLPGGHRRLTACWPYSVDWLARLRAARGFDLAVWAVGSGWFLFLAVVTGETAFSHGKNIGIADSTLAEWAALLASVCLMLFYVVLWLLMLLRRAPIARDDRLLPSFVAFVGTYLPWSIVLFGGARASAGRDLASAVLLLVGAALMVAVIIPLGRSFSIVPQARQLVTSGPYAIVRNPLYLAEEIALLGMLLQFWSLVTLAVLLAHGALQVQRIFYEEGLLRRSFADYDRYARTTPRLLPCIW